MRQNGKCPVCESSSIDVFLRREQVPVHQNIVVKSQEAAVNITRGDLELAVCHQCGFVFNQSFDLSRLSYGREYDNTQTCSPSFNKYVDDLVRHMVEERSVVNCRVAEVGCGKGVFLRKLVEYEDSGNYGYGFDPSYVGPMIDLDGRLRFEKRFYDETCSNIPVDVIVCRHVIEHVPDPLELLRTIRKSLVHSPKTRVFFETPCVEWILKNQVIWDFFYEHCSYFTAQSLSTAFENSGFRVESVEHVFEEQYLWLEATVAAEEIPASKSPGVIPSLAYEFAKSENEIRNYWMEKIQTEVAAGGVALWGAGAKGVTMANLIDPKRELISCVVDLNPQKQGGYIPGTGHAIVGIQSLSSYGIRTAILMNPNYREENLTLLKEANLDIQLV